MTDDTKTTNTPRDGDRDLSEETKKRLEPLREQLHSFRYAVLPVDHFATTNWDNWLKDGVGKAKNTSPRVSSPNDPGAFSDLGPGSSPLVLMLHGDADRPDSCVLRPDPDLRLLMDQWRLQVEGEGAPPRHWFLGTGLRRLDVGWFRRKGVEPIEYGPKARTSSSLWMVMTPSSLQKNTTLSPS